MKIISPGTENRTQIFQNKTIIVKVFICPFVGMFICRGLTKMVVVQLKHVIESL